MARLVESGVDVRDVALSIATRSLPEGFPPDTPRARGVRYARRPMVARRRAAELHELRILQLAVDQPPHASLGLDAGPALLGHCSLVESRASGVARLTCSGWVHGLC
jgi:hypothetical protein